MAAASAAPAMVDTLFLGPGTIDNAGGVRVVNVASTRSWCGFLPQKDCQLITNVFYNAPKFFGAKNPLRFVHADLYNVPLELVAVVDAQMLIAAKGKTPALLFILGFTGDVARSQIRTLMRRLLAEIWTRKGATEAVMDSVLMTLRPFTSEVCKTLGLRFRFDFMDANMATFRLKLEDAMGQKYYDHEKYYLALLDQQRQIINGERPGFKLGGFIDMDKFAEVRAELHRQSQLAIGNGEEVQAISDGSEYELDYAAAKVAANSVVDVELHGQYLLRFKAEDSDKITALMNDEKFRASSYDRDLEQQLAFLSGIAEPVETFQHGYTQVPELISNDQYFMIARQHGSQSHLRWHHASVHSEVHRQGDGDLACVRQEGRALRVQPV